MSHYTTQALSELLSLIQEAVDDHSKKLKRQFSLGIAIEIKGPEIRTGELKDVNNKDSHLVFQQTQFCA